MRPRVTVGLRAPNPAKKSRTGQQVSHRCGCTQSEIREKSGQKNVVVRIKGKKPRTVCFPLRMDKNAQKKIGLWWNIVLLIKTIFDKKRTTFWGVKGEELRSNMQTVFNVNVNNNADPLQTLSPWEEGGP